MVGLYDVSNIRYFLSATVRPTRPPRDAHNYRAQHIAQCVHLPTDRGSPHGYEGSAG